MLGQKLKDCKSTLEAMLRPLGSKDRFGLIVFGSRVRVIILAALMTKENKESALNQIKEITTKGSINFSGGLTMAWKELLLIDNPNSVRSLFLLTDGLANEGIKQTSTLAQMVKCLTADSAEEVSEALNFGLTQSCTVRFFLFTQVDAASLVLGAENIRAPVSLFCFGYGSNHNSDMRQTLAEATAGGGYYFVENDSDIYTTFGDAMGGIMSVMALSRSQSHRLQQRLASRFAMCTTTRRSTEATEPSLSILMISMPKNVVMSLWTLTSRMLQAMSQSLILLPRSLT